MKNLVIGLLVIGFTSLGFSQNNNSEIEEEQLKGILNYNLNLNYLEKVQEKELPANVKSLVNEASVFDVKGLPEFDGRKESFQVMFKSNKGFIIADYDRNGKILKTSERYKDIALPRNLIKAVLKKYPNSNFLKVAYTVDYNDQNTAKKIYKIQIINDDKKKNLKINTEGNLKNFLTMRLNN